MVQAVHPFQLLGNGALAAKITQPMRDKNFDAEAHFESKLKGSSIRDHGTVISFAARPFSPARRPAEKGIKRVVREKFKYEEFKKINGMHTAYMRQLVGRLSPDAAMDAIYRAELTGAEIVVNGTAGFVIEERKNSLTVIFRGDRVKVFPKAVWDFTYVLDGVEYIFYAAALKKGRFLK